MRLLAGGAGLKIAAGRGRGRACQIESILAALGRS